jgi:hypothetical protein
MENVQVVHIRNITDGTQLKIDGEDELHAIGKKICQCQEIVSAKTSKFPSN